MLVSLFQVPLVPEGFWTQFPMVGVLMGAGYLFIKFHQAEIDKWRTMLKENQERYERLLDASTNSGEKFERAIDRITVRCQNIQSGKITLME